LLPISFTDLSSLVKYVFCAVGVLPTLGKKGLSDKRFWVMKEKVWEAPT
jgi:hypothetical protein